MIFYWSCTRFKLALANIITVIRFITFLATPPRHPQLFFFFFFLIIQMSYYIFNTNSASSNKLADYGSFHMGLWRFTRSEESHSDK